MTRQPGWGVSVSLKLCRAFSIDPVDCIAALSKELGFKRFRLMSYWDEHEPRSGIYDFSALDQQVKQVKKLGGVITLCLGVRQPRWPESHWPKWVLKLPRTQRYEALYTFVETVIQRYQHESCIVSWQLENEALNRGFGLNGDFNRQRLRHEYSLVKKLDSTRPIIMSTSNTWGVPLRRPRPDMFGFTFYQVQFEGGAYSRTKVPWWWCNIRRALVWAHTLRPSFIHELQAEPWGPKAIWEMSVEEQNKSMNIDQLKTNIECAKQTKLYPIDLWGGEWWYWRKTVHHDPSIWNTIRTALLDDSS